jgi:hypothetical protein
MIVIPDIMFQHETAVVARQVRWTEDESIKNAKEEPASG